MDDSMPIESYQDFSGPIRQAMHHTVHGQANALPDKVPPQNQEAEQSLLGCLMLDKNAIVKIADIVSAGDFYYDRHNIIFETMIDLYKDSQPIDVLSVTNRLQEKKQLDQTGGISYLTSLINTIPTAAHVAHYAQIVRRKKILRDLINASHFIAQLGWHEQEQDLATILDQAEQSIFEVSRKSIQQKFLPVKDSLDEAFERLDHLHREGRAFRGVPTGFIELDNYLSGLQKSDLIILAARPSLGKTSLATDMARNIAVEHKVPVGICSLEMSRHDIVDRLISAQAGVDLWRLRTGRLSMKGENNDLERVKNALAILSESPIFIDDTASPTVMQIRTVARRLQAEHGLGLLMVDYLQLIQPPNSAVPMVQQVTEISRNLKALARELEIPVIAVSQLSRAVESRSPQIPRLSDLRESGCLAGDTLITRADTGERFPIKDLVGQTDIPVHTLDEDWRVKKGKISRVFCSGEKMIYELTTRSGFKIKASANHPFWKINGWTRLDELKIGDRIATPKELKLSTPKNELSDNEIILLAHLLGDGCVLPRQPYHYTSADQKNIKIVVQAAKSLFKITPKIIKQKNWWHVYLTSPYRLTHKKFHPITEWFDKLGIQRVHSWEKEIPQKVFSLSEEKIALFLRHLWATDGHIGHRQIKKKNGKPGSKVGTIYYASTSQKLAQDVKYLLLRLGIRSKIRATKKENYRICYQVWIDGTKHQMNFLENIGSFGDRGKIVPLVIEKLKKIRPNTNLDVWPKETWRLIINPIREKQNLSWRDFSAGIDTAYCGTTLFKHGIGAERMQRIAQYLQSPIIDNMAKANIFWDEIIAIKSVGVEKVYDATVPGHHNFVANGIIVENSIEQDADVVLFIYREDREKEDSDRRNIADILIAKHRNGPTGKVELYFDESQVSFKNLEKHYQ